MKHFIWLTILTSLFVLGVNGQRNKLSKKFKGEDQESFQLGILEALDISSKGKKIRLIYNSKIDRSDEVDSLLEISMAKYDILYSGYFVSFCGTNEDPAYDAGFDYIMDSLIVARYGKNFIDSLVKVAEYENQLAINKKLKSFEESDSIDCQYCDKKNFTNRSGWFIGRDIMFNALQKLDNENNNFSFVWNCVNNKRLEFDVHVGMDGQVYLVNNFGVTNYPSGNQNIEEYKAVIDFVTENIKSNIPYPICNYKKKFKRYTIRQFVCFSWTINN